MSMYNMIFGVSGNSDILLELLSLTKKDFYRFRDCYLDEDKNIAVYTRGGGNNRLCWDCVNMHDLPDNAVDDQWGDPHVPECVEIIQPILRTHGSYIRDEDDDYDNTYCTFYFKVPDDALEQIKYMDLESDRNDIWVTFLDALKKKSAAL